MRKNHAERIRSPKPLRDSVHRNKAFHEIPMTRKTKLPKERQEMPRDDRHGGQSRADGQNKSAASQSLSPLIVHGKRVLHRRLVWKS